MRRRLLLLLVLSLTTAGCRWCEVEKTRAPRPSYRPMRSPAPRQAAPVVRQEQVDVPRELQGAVIELTGASRSGLIRRGQVELRLDPVDARECDDLQVLVARTEPDPVDGRVYSACLAPLLTERVFAFRVRLRHGLPHVLDVRTLPIALRRAAGRIIGGSLSGLGGLEGAWRATFPSSDDEPGGLVMAGPSGRIGRTGGESRLMELRQPPPAMRNRLRSQSSNLGRTLLPGESYDGWIVIEIPSNVPLAEPLTLGIYDVVVDTDKAARPKQVVALEATFIRRAWSMEVNVTQTRTVTVMPGTRPEPKPPTPEDSSPETVPLGSVYTAVSGTPVVAEWVQRRVVALYPDGSRVEGVLLGVRTLKLLLRLDSGDRVELDMLQLRSVTKAQEQVP